MSKRQRNAAQGSPPTRDPPPNGTRSDSKPRPFVTIDKRWLWAIAFAVGGVLLVVAICRFTRREPPPTQPGSGEHAAAEGGEPTSLQYLQHLSAASQVLSDQVRRAVVRVEATDIHTDTADNEIAQLFGAAPPAFGQGSGVIVETDGYVLTNYHVIRGAREISVVVAGSQRYAATVVGSDALTDLAVLKIDANGLETIMWGDSDELHVGAFVWAIGSPFGLEGSVSFGIVSAKNREALVSSPFQAFLQTDAAVNPGNSGGPLVDVNGAVVGINTAILGSGFQGISFAIPSNTVQEIHESLKRDGRVARGWLGVTLDPLTRQRAAQLGLGEGDGVYVVSVANASPARTAGIRPGDVITHWNGEPIGDPIKLSRVVALSPIGSNAEITVIRDRRTLNVPLIVGDRP